jgi:hypothetical protein
MAWEPIALNGGVTLHHDVVDGVSTYWVATGGPFRAVLAFRVGAADETLPIRGICHLVEHLAIEPKPASITTTGGARSIRRVSGPRATGTRCWATSRV